MRAADTGPESAGHPGAVPPHPAGRGNGAGAAPTAGTGNRSSTRAERARGNGRGRGGGHGNGRGNGRGRRRAAKPGPSVLRRTAFGTAGLLCLVLGTSLALSGREAPVVRIESSGHGTGTDTPPSAPTTGTTGTAGTTGTTGAAAPKPYAPSPPTRLLVPAAGVDAPVADLGLNTDGTVQVPPADRGEEVGWYRNGPTPGETGPAVLIGHYDTVHGPAVFRQLPKLRPGELIQVRRADGSTVDFKVRALFQAAKDNFPTQQVYGDTPAPALRLITCGGRIGSDGHWTDNIIVLADLA
ncbi:MULTISPECIES: class F sortase [Streptomyces]|uniref:class F sortase n=1 Tax=Streptomyces TaxID=1883 RepID=UPI000AD78C85|nr:MULTISPECIES: class F sortase [Streptomyces]